MASFRQLDATKIIETLRELSRRIGERFPDSGLSRVAENLVRVGTDHKEAVDSIKAGHGGLRGVILLVILGGLAALVGVLVSLAGQRIVWAPSRGSELVGLIEASIGTVVFLGAAVIYLFSLETRWRRARALRKIHELRAIAHVVDMHQLRKDPDRIDRKGPDTASSPKLDLTPFELGRYLDYCSELQALIAKVGALYVQGYEDPVASSAVDELENLTTGLSRKIWQKIMVLDRLTGSPSN